MRSTFSSNLSVVLHRVCAGRSSALGQDQDEHRDHGRQKRTHVREELAGSDSRQPDRRQAAGHCPDGGDAAGGESERVTQENHPDHGDQRTWDLLVDLAEAHDQGQDGERHGQGGGSLRH